MVALGKARDKRTMEKRISFFMVNGNKGIQ
jgi:hypothetical protein